MRVLYVNPIEYRANPDIDMLGHGLAHIWIPWDEHVPVRPFRAGL